ncbi:hypothetical protein [Flavobacterium luminosum]|uniref:Lipoprotein n=1 Tax=Flavobacterium luminosum TaxID=2949086 RepID=A0ABT0TK87_9FLAO|nr:hypothetical protein [Flavobacterium sp. HXWNR70]MCL9807905.1 hypothetical protein [Flavobacterium sp. HXWNR70]
MKKILFLLVLTLGITSCTFTEEIMINPDGSGKYILQMDGSAFMAMMPKDSVSGSMGKSIDSVFSFKKILEEKKDSITKLSLKEQERLKKLENFKMHLKMKEDSKEFLFSLFSPFSSVAELQEMTNNIKELNALDKKTQSIGPMSDIGIFGNNGATMNYTYNGKKFTRKAVANQSQQKDLKNDSLNSYQMIFESSKYIVKYHFPKAVKKVNNPTALFSEDRKTITLEYSFNEYRREPEKLNLEIEFVK